MNFKYNLSFSFVYVKLRIHVKTFAKEILQPFDINMSTL